MTRMGRCATRKRCLLRAEPGGARNEFVLVFRHHVGLFSLKNMFK